MNSTTLSEPLFTSAVFSFILIFTVWQQLHCKMIPKCYFRLHWEKKPMESWTHKQICHITVTPVCILYARMSHSFHPLQLMIQVWWRYRWLSVTRSSLIQWCLSIRPAHFLHCHHLSTTGFLWMVRFLLYCLWLIYDDCICCFSHFAFCFLHSIILLHNPSPFLLILFEHRPLWL